MDQLDERYKGLLSDQQAEIRQQFKLASEERHKQEKAYAIAQAQLQDKHKNELDTAVRMYESRL
jgi:hypothetical protein